jgi:hypothetical protein
MAKKRKRQSRRVKRTASPAAVRATTAPRRRSAQEFNPDYSYIKTDLQRIGILSASFLAILIVLAFFLN